MTTKRRKRYSPEQIVCKLLVLFKQFQRRWLLAACLAEFTFAACLSSASGVTIGGPELIGAITSSALDEVSGLVASRTNTDTLWVHNDSGDSPRFFAVSTSGALLGTFPLAGATARDWEDIAIGLKPGGGNYLYLGDIGDNDAVRSSITIYRTDEPQSTASTTIPACSYSRAIIQYPSGPRNAESLFADPLTGDVFIVTKMATTEIYSVPATAFDDPDGATTATALGNLGAPLRYATAADISPDGRFVLVRSSTKASPADPNVGYLFERGSGESVADALHGAGISFPLGVESQGEAIGWAADGKSFFTTSEFNKLDSAPIYSFSFTAPPALPGDYNNDHQVDAADYTVWRNQLGAHVTLPNESDTPDLVTAEDYNVWRDHFGQSLSGEAAVGISTTGVPEPATLLISVMGAMLLVTQRPSRRW